jgi:hypothetical protein
VEAHLKKGYFLTLQTLSFLNYFGNTVSTKIEEFSLEFSCIIVETANKEKPSGPTFGEGIILCEAI